MTDQPRGKRQRALRLRQASFTGRQAEIDIFRRLLPLNRDDVTGLLMIYGIGGIGKSALLDELYRLAAAVNCWIARLDPRVQAGILDFLGAMHNQLKGQVRFPSYEEGLARRREIENKLLARSDIPRNVLELLARGVRAAVQQVPVAGPLVAEFINPEQVIAVIYSAVGRVEADFWLKPEEDLTARLVADLNAYTMQQRILLMFDNYEWIGDFDHWVREALFEPLESHVLFVLAGRRRLEGREWEEFNDFIEQVKLEPLTNGEARTYLAKKGIVDPATQEAMADYADGLPLYLAILTELAEHGGGVSDLGRVATRQDFVDKLLARIKESMTANLGTALEACAILRGVDEDNLAYMLDQDNIGPLYDAVRSLDFVKRRNDGGLTLHEVVWDAMNHELRLRNAARYCELHERAATYYEIALARPTVQNRERKELERLYHHIRSNESKGIELFQQMAEGLVRVRLISRLQSLLSEVKGIELADENSRLWCEYYEGRLAHLRLDFALAEHKYRKVSESSYAEPKLRAYALCDWGELWHRLERLGQPGGAEQTLRILEESIRTAPHVDAKLVPAYETMCMAHIYKGKWDTGLALLEKQFRFFSDRNDKCGMVATLASLKNMYGLRGLWRKAYNVLDEGLELLKSMGESPYLRERLRGTRPWVYLWTGRYADAEVYMQAGLDFFEQVGDQDAGEGHMKSIAFIKGLQGKYVEADSTFELAVAAYESLGPEFVGRLGDVLGFWGYVLVKRKEYERAGEYLKQSLQYKQQALDHTGVQEVCNWLGELEEASKQENIGSAHLEKAIAAYEQSLNNRWIGRLYFECGALTGLVRVRYAEGNYGSLPFLLSEAQPLAENYEYNDHLASLRLTQGHAVWDRLVPHWGTGFEASLGYYQQALVYALRFNRFLLDEVLWGGGVGTPLRPIIPHCLERGGDGLRMLTALRDWWQTGLNAVGATRPDTISPLPEGIPLVEAERVAREREPGDGSPQQLLIAHITARLASSV